MAEPSKVWCKRCLAGLDAVELREADEPQPETVWRYIGKRDRVRVHRVWTGYPPMEGCVAVRAHRVNGGKPWVAPLCEFVKRFEAE